MPSFQEADGLKIENCRADWRNTGLPQKNTDRNAFLFWVFELLVLFLRRLVLQLLLQIANSGGGDRLGTNGHNCS